MTENITVYARWEQISSTVNVIGKDRIYMTDEEIEMRREILKRQYLPAFSNNQIARFIQRLWELLKQPQYTPSPQTAQSTYIDGFGYVPKGNATQTTIGESSGDINKIIANMKKMQFYVCPICGNVINSLGDGYFACCGINLPKLEAESPDSEHKICVEQVENEHLITMNHPMIKNHYISFIVYISSDTVEIKKLYPEQDICVRFKRKGHGILYVYCNKHGMFKLIL